MGLGRDPSVVSREISRNGGHENYRAHAAQERFEALRARPRLRKLEADRRLHDEVNAGLAQRWSPQQISARMRRDHPDNEAMRASHEMVYESLYVQARGELHTELKLSLRHGRARRMPHGSTRVKAARIAGMVNISERPAEVADRALPGHWEGDLIMGKGGKSQVATLASHRRTRRAPAGAHRPRRRPRRLRSQPRTSRQHHRRRTTSAETTPQPRGVDGRPGRLEPLG